MTSSASEAEQARAVRVKVSRDALAVDLVDGRTVIVPLAWYPRLLHGSAGERGRWRLIARGVGIHWPDLDEDISVAALLAGKPSGESQRSLETWLAGRRRPDTDTAPGRGHGAARTRTAASRSGRRG
jgi:hypothetical protein